MKQHVVTYQAMQGDSDWRQDLIKIKEILPKE
jgi:hypothetical protein